MEQIENQIELEREKRLTKHGNADGLGIDEFEVDLVSSGTEKIISPQQENGNLQRFFAIRVGIQFELGEGNVTGDRCLGNGIHEFVQGER